MIQHRCSRYVFNRVSLIFPEKLKPSRNRFLLQEHRVLKLFEAVPGYGLSKNAKLHFSAKILYFKIFRRKENTSKKSGHFWVKRSTYPLICLPRLSALPYGTCCNAESIPYLLLDFSLQCLQLMIPCSFQNLKNRYNRHNLQQLMIPCSFQNLKNRYNHHKSQQLMLPYGRAERRGRHQRTGKLDHFSLGRRSKTYH